MSRLQQLLDRVVKIVDQDTRMVVEINRAMKRMADLGLTSLHVRAMLDAEPVDGLVLHDTGFHGFESRRQAGYAALAGLPKKEWPAALQACHERVTAYIRNQEPESAGSDEAAIVMMPIVVMDQKPVKRFRRMRSGKIKEIGAAADDPIDVEAEDLATVEVGK